jgi:hypothetical protein
VLAAEHEQLAGEGILLQVLLHEAREAVEAPALMCCRT